MTTGDAAAGGGQTSLRAIVHAALPPSARPTSTYSQPLHRHVIERSPDDVIALTRQQVGEQFGDEPHIVLCLRSEDLDPQQDGDVLGVLERTGGGVVVFGVGYVLGEVT